MSEIQIVRPNLRDVAYIAGHLRGRDAAEIMPLRIDKRPEVMAAAVSHWQVSYMARRIASDGACLPIAVWGAFRHYPTVWEVGAWGTKRFPEAAGAITRHIMAVVIPELYGRGATRAECLTLSTYDKAHRWLEFLGARREFADAPNGGLIEGLGEGGESYYRYVWTRADIPRAGRGA